MAESSQQVPHRRISAVIVTYNRPILLLRCLTAVLGQSHPTHETIVVDNGSDTPVAGLLAGLPAIRLLRLVVNAGPAAGYAAGIGAALAGGATHAWLMDDDGLPGDPACLAGLVQTAEQTGAALTCPLVRNVDAPARLAFPIRQRGRTRFATADLEPGRMIEGFAHLFNGALVTAAAFDRIGLPDPRLFMRGDEVEFSLRARRAGLKMVTDTHVAFLHPACDAEVRPILGGAFYAMVPRDALKQHCQFRNRGWIFSRYGMWGWLAADHVRYALHYLFGARNPSGYAAWLRATWSGVRGELGSPLVPRHHPPDTTPANTRMLGRML